MIDTLQSKRTNAAKCGPETPVMLYVHGGAWCMPFDKNAAAEFFAGIAESGWAAYSMNYVLPGIWRRSPTGRRSSRPSYQQHKFRARASCSAVGGSTPSRA